MNKSNFIKSVAINDLEVFKQLLETRLNGHKSFIGLKRVVIKNSYLEDEIFTSVVLDLCLSKIRKTKSNRIAMKYYKYAIDQLLLCGIYVSGSFGTMSQMKAYMSLVSGIQDIHAGAMDIEQISKCNREYYNKFTSDSRSSIHPDVDSDFRSFCLSKVVPLQMVGGNSGVGRSPLHGGAIRGQRANVVWFDNTQSFSDFETVADLSKVRGGEGQIVYASSNESDLIPNDVIEEAIKPFLKEESDGE